ncbi:hypothetical protein BGS_0675 [Beggiatoa sp. SS]|nr:hypothetical protein BGS_0675 [Beggiatoa sp. SS]
MAKWLLNVSSFHFTLLTINLCVKSMLEWGYKGQRLAHWFAKKLHIIDNKRDSKSDDG